MPIVALATTQGKECVCVCACDSMSLLDACASLNATKGRIAGSEALLGSDNYHVRAGRSIWKVERRRRKTVGSKP